MDNTTARGLPAELVFAPDWWHRHYGVCFDKDFFFHPARRVEEERRMRNALRERFPELYSHFVDEDRPVAGSVLLATGSLLAEVVGCRAIYREDSAPEVFPLSVSDSEMEAYQPVDLASNPTMARMRALLDALEARFGYVEGDFNVGGVLNLALSVRGQGLYLDFYDRPETARRFLGCVTQTLAGFFSEVRSRTGTTSVSINRSIIHVNPAITIGGNCSVQMISPETYEKHLLEFDVRLARSFQPFGIHHCGDNMHLVAGAYAQIPGACWFDVGWGSDVAECRRRLPDAFLNIRFNPVVLAQCTPADVHRHLASIVAHAAPYDRVGVCCINMDASVPDENVRALIAFAREFDRSQ